jgi:hypothetical protein
MATLRTFLVNLSPAKRTTHGFTAELSYAMGQTPHEVTVDSFAKLESEVRRLAQEFGQTCAPFIRLKDRGARKPVGFDRFTDSLRIIDVAAEG